MMITMNCKVPIVLANIATVYILASLGYLVYTRIFSDTPFRKAVEQYPQLVRIKQKSAHHRRTVFYTSLIVATAATCIIRPFRACLPE